MSKRNLTLLTDLYELTMMQGYYEKGQNEKVIFDVFFRQNPCNNGYSVCAGLDQVIDYIKKMENVISGIDNVEDTNDIFELIIEIANIFQNEIPEIKNSILLRNGTEIRDANTVIGLLKLYLANNDIEYKEESEENRKIKRFWTAFMLWFETELVNLELLKEKYVRWDNWNGGTWYLDIDFDYEYKMYRGTNYPESLKRNDGNISDIKNFIEIAYKYWIKNDGKSHYDFTIEVNERLKIFKLPYRLQNGILRKQGYKTTYGIDKILNYRMFERKIRFSEDMINSRDLMEKKSALDFLIDSLQYLISTQEGNRAKQYSQLAATVDQNTNSKVYVVIKNELNELMKLSNEYFDIRHNDYLNASKQQREALNDSQFIEYLYNRAYALLYLLRLKQTIND